MTGFFNLDWTRGEPTAADLAAIEADPDVQEILSTSNEDALAELAREGIPPARVYSSLEKALQRFSEKT